MTLLVDSDVIRDSDITSGMVTFVVDSGWIVECFCGVICDGGVNEFFLSFCWIELWWRCE